MNQTNNAASGPGRTAAPKPEPVPVGMTEWKRNQIAEAVASYDRHLKLPKPMVAIRNLSPEFLELAIRLDTLLGEFRDKYGRARLLRRHCERRGVPMEQLNSRGETGPVPELERIEKIGDAAYHAVVAMIGTIEKTKAVRYADRNLKKRAGELLLCPWFRQLDWLHELYDQDNGDLR